MNILWFYPFLEIPSVFIALSSVTQFDENFLCIFFCSFLLQLLARGLHELLNYDGNVAEAFEQPFCIADVDMFGMPQVHKLKPDGDQIVVTNETRQVAEQREIN